MFFVVWGHVYVRPIEECSYVRNFIVSFNMPFFFVVSGYFATANLKQRKIHKLCSSVMSWLWAMLSTSVLFVSIICLQNYSIFDFHSKLAQYFFGAAWFIWTLVACYLLAYLLYWFNGKKCFMWLLCGMILVLIVVDVYLSGAMYSSEIDEMLPYYLVGTFITEDHLKSRKYRSVGVSCLLLYAVIVGLYGNVTENGMGFYWVDSVLSSKWVLFKIGRFTIALIGCCGVAWLVWNLMPLWRRCCWVASIGTTTLGVYLLHQPFLIFLKKITPEYFFDLSCAPFVAIAVLLIMHSIVLVTRRVPIMHRIMWGNK